MKSTRLIMTATLIASLTCTTSLATEPCTKAVKTATPCVGVVLPRKGFAKCLKLRDVVVPNLRGEVTALKKKNIAWQRDLAAQLESCENQLGRKPPPEVQSVSPWGYVITGVVSLAAGVVLRHLIQP